MRTFTLLFSLIGLLGAALVLRAQDPGAQQDAEAARAKLLKAADQIDMIETNSEGTKTSIAAMKGDIVKLQDQNATLKQQLADLQTAFEKSEAAHAKEQQVLLDEVAKMVATSKSPAAPVKSAAKKKEPIAAAPATPAAPKISGGDMAATGTAPASAAGTEATPPAKSQKGYYHIVESGETLTLICSAYREQGVNVTPAEVQKANGLTDKSVLKVGQKLFIPKPGA